RRRQVTPATSNSGESGLCACSCLPACSSLPSFPELRLAAEVEDGGNARERNPPSELDARTRLDIQQDLDQSLCGGDGPSRARCVPGGSQVAPGHRVLDGADQIVVSEVGWRGLASTSA